MTDTDKLNMIIEYVKKDEQHRLKQARERGGSFTAGAAIAIQSLVSFIENGLEIKMH